MNERNPMNPNDRAVLERIAAGDTVHSQRARALLALDGGATQSVAAKESGLTISSVRYWRARFVDKGLSIFPEGLTAESETAGMPAMDTEPVKEKKDNKKSKGDRKKSGKKGKKKAGKKNKKKKSKK